MNHPAPKSRSELGVVGKFGARFTPASIVLISVAILSTTAFVWPPVSLLALKSASS